MNKKMIVIKISLNTFRFGDYRFTEEWLKERIGVFMNFTFKSLIRQSNQRFIAFVEYEHCTEGLVKQALSKYPALPHNIRFVSNNSDYISNTVKGYKYLYLVRLDSDDMYHPSFVQKLQDITVRRQTRVLLNQKGFIYDSLRNRLGCYYHQSPPFYVLVYRVKDYLKGKRHELKNGHCGAINLQHQIIEGSNFMIVIHQLNSSTRFGNHFMTEEINNIGEKDRILQEFIG